MQLGPHEYITRGIIRLFHGSYAAKYVGVGFSERGLIRLVHQASVDFVAAIHFLDVHYGV
jgi:hypothetical protein